MTLSHVGHPITHYIISLKLTYEYMQTCNKAYFNESMNLKENKEGGFRERKENKNVVNI